MNRAKFQKQIVRTWEKIKRLLTTQVEISLCGFSKHHFHSISEVKTRTQICGRMPEYTQKFHRLASKYNLNEIEDQQMARYIGCLKSSIQENVTM